MYRIYCDNYLIHDDHVDSLKVVNPVVSLELNTVGSLEFDIYPSHPYFNRLQRMKSIITVYQGNKIIFKGRMISDVNGFHNEKKVTCEGDLAFLLDSIQRPYEFNGTPSELFTQLIQNHNSQVNEDHQFKVGNITVTDPNDYIARSDTTYQNTWDAVQDKLVKGLGGYLWTRYEEDGTYIDYLEDFNVLSPQKIEFGKNLVDFQKTIKAEELFTVIVPIGAEIEVESSTKAEGDSETIKEKLTIKDVNGGLDYLENTEAIAKYGRIVKMVEWQDVTEADNLKRKGQAYLDEHTVFTNTITLTAADLSSVNSNFSAFHLGTKVQVISKPHDLDLIMLVNKISINLMNPSENKLELGTSIDSLTDAQHNVVQNITTQVQESVNNASMNIVDVVTRQTQSIIEASSESITSTVSEQFYSKGDVDNLIGEIRTDLEQTTNGWTFTFEGFQRSINDTNEIVDAEFQEIKKNIDFINGEIIIGNNQTDLNVVISNDRMSFRKGQIEVAYISDEKLYITDGEFLNSLQLGKFAFIPRDTGNLSFKKVVK